MIEFHNLSPFVLSFPAAGDGIGCTVRRGCGARVPAADFWQYAGTSDGREVIRNRWIRLTGESKTPDNVAKLAAVRQGAADARAPQDGAQPLQMPGPDTEPKIKHIAACDDVDLLLAWLSLDKISEAKRARITKRIEAVDPDFGDAEG